MSANKSRRGFSVLLGNLQNVTNNTHRIYSVTMFQCPVREPAECDVETVINCGVKTLFQCPVREPAECDFCVEIVKSLLTSVSVLAAM